MFILYLVSSFPYAFLKTKQWFLWQVDARLVDIKESAVANRTFLDGHVSSIEGITTDAKRKWQAFAMQAEIDAKDAADYSAAKHCRIEELLKHW